MTDREVYEAALLEATECERRAAELRAWIKMHDQIAARLSANYSQGSVQVSASVSALTVDAPRSEGRPVRGRGLSQADFNEALLKLFDEIGRPLNKFEITEELGERGIRPSGADPVNAVGTKLNRARQLIVLVAGRRYWPVGRPVPAAGQEADRRQLANETDERDGSEAVDHYAGGSSDSRFSDLGLPN